MRVHALHRAPATQRASVRSCRYLALFPPQPLVHRSCQTWCVSAHDAVDRAETIAHELAACRQRGIEGLDRSTHNQTPIDVPELERLARDYAAARRAEWRRRKDQIKTLLRDALLSFDRSDADLAGLIRDLFFGSDTGTVRRGPSDLLRTPGTPTASPAMPGSVRFAVRRCTISPSSSSASWRHRPKHLVFAVLPRFPTGRVIPSVRHRRAMPIPV